jgi:hypothetical protein
MDTLTLYQVDLFGAFTGATWAARRSPADKDPVWLIPDGATTLAPPPAGDGEVAVLRDGKWSVVPDYRGQSLYDKATGIARVIEAPGEISDGETLQAPPSPRHVWAVDRWTLPFADAKVAQVAKVGTELARRNSAGFAYEGVLYQLDETSQVRIASLTVLAMVNEGVGWPEQFAFIAADNSPIPFTASAFATFGAAAALMVTKRRLNARALKDAILTTADSVALEAIDLTVGWD